MAKKTDGQSIERTIPEGVTITLHEYYLIDGVFGEALSTDAAETVVVLDVAHNEGRGESATAVYVDGEAVWFNGATQTFVEAPVDGLETATLKKVGRCTVASDDNDVFDFKQTYSA